MIEKSRTLECLCMETAGHFALQDRRGVSDMDDIDNQTLLRKTLLGVFLAMSQNGWGGPKSSTNAFSCLLLSSLICISIGAMRYMCRAG